MIAQKAQSMANDTQIDIPGLSDLYKLMQDLPVKVEKNIMRGALRAGQKIMLNAVQEQLRANNSYHTGKLARSLKIRFKRKAEKRGFVSSFLSAGSAEAYYANWVEFGTAAHFISVKKEARPTRLTRRGIREYSLKTINRMVNRGSLVIGKNFVGASVAHPGAKPKPFMRPAFDSNKEQSITAISDYIRKRLPKELKKAGL